MTNTANTLADVFSIKRRYSRSVNLERDLEKTDALEGYILTERSVDALRRVLSGIKEETSSSWTLTSVYGTGKSAFAHYLASLCASSKSKMRSLSWEITQTALGVESVQRTGVEHGEETSLFPPDEYQALESSIPKQGYLRAVAVAQREPISNTVVRALLRGAETFWTPAKLKKIDAVSRLQELATEIELGNKIDGKEIPALVKELAKASKTGIFLTKQTKRLSPEAVAILQALQKTVEPDELLFVEFPKACGLPAIGTDEAEDGITAKELRMKLVKVIKELSQAYDKLLADCKSLLLDAFGVRRGEPKLREDLRVRSNYLIDKCIEPTLKRFTKAAVDETVDNEQWLKALVMIVADKPAESWTDQDVTRFEIELADLVRKFQNLEALQKETTAKGGGFEARRITVTHADGQETLKQPLIIAA